MRIKAIALKEIPDWKTRQFKSITSIDWEDIWQVSVSCVISMPQGPREGQSTSPSRLLCPSVFCLILETGFLYVALTGQGLTV